MADETHGRKVYDCTDFETEIDAPAEVVFDTIKDVGVWSSWTTAVHEAWARSQGPWRRGYKFVMKTIISAAPLPMTVYEYEENRRIGWGVKNPLFTVLHRILVEPISPTRCRVRNHEFVTGPLAGVVGRLVGARIDRFDRQLTADLAVRCAGAR